MSEGIYITKTDFNQLMKKVAFLEEWIRNSSKPRLMHNWLTEEEAMTIIGCKKTKIKQLRRDRLIEWKNTGSRGVRISRASIEAYTEAMTNEGIYRIPTRKQSA